MAELPELASDAAAQAGDAAPEFFKPYPDLSVNFIYNLLFCDNISLFRSEDDSVPGEPWRTLLQEPPDTHALRVLSEDEANESRLRALACHRLFRTGAQVSGKRLFAVIVEVPLSHGLDVLAAYADGQVRYINHAGAMSFFDVGPGDVNVRARRLVISAKPFVQQPGPCAKARMAPPVGDRIRMSFVASDGLRVAEGRFDALQKDARCGPVLAAALSLLQTINTTAQR